ncbi:2-oxoglutarate and iron-dependent oxygenase domain-containing protein [Streptomyces sp. NBC_01233]|uniref:2-oxoglutarate and iron-dependent oxygenase domain-containing protein n=1 Tax=Streptomyces sp. NBC_01233 TaxID=2903787 RepID=UPI003FA3548E
MKRGSSSFRRPSGSPSRGDGHGRVRDIRGAGPGDRHGGGRGARPGETAAWRRDGTFQVSADAGQRARTREAPAASRRFFARPPAQKTAYVNDTSYSGYIASGEEVTAGERDASEIFTTTPDLTAARGLPCHGRCPGPIPATARPWRPTSRGWARSASACCGWWRSGWAPASGRGRPASTGSPP